MKRRRSARSARPSRDRPASANSRSPGKRALRAGKSGKSRKKIKKSASTQPSNKNTPQFDQLSPVMTNYKLSRRRPHRRTFGRGPRTACPPKPRRRRACHAAAQRRRACRAAAERRRMDSSFASFRVFSGHIRPQTVDCGPWTVCRAVAQRRRVDCRTFLHHFCTVFASLFGLCFSQLTLPQPFPHLPIAAWCNSASHPFACIPTDSNPRLIVQDRHPSLNTYAQSRDDR